MKNLNKENNRRIENVLKSNYIIISLYLVYFILLSLIFSDIFMPLLILHLILIALSFTPIGEAYIRLVNGVKKVDDKRDIESYNTLIEAFTEVYSRSLEESPSLNRNIKIFINNDDNPNAFACGSSTVCVSSSSLEFFSEDEIKGIIAHELGHLNNWDTKILLMALSSNIVISVILFCFNFFFLIGEAVLSSMGSNNSFISKIIMHIKNTLLSIVKFVMTSITSLSSRTSERLADRFSYDIGYGEELKNGLEKLKILSPSKTMTITEALHSTHPQIDERIGHLEMLLSCNGEGIYPTVQTAKININTSKPLIHITNDYENIEEITKITDEQETDIEEDWERYVKTFLKCVDISNSSLERKFREYKNKIEEEKGKQLVNMFLRGIKIDFNLLSYQDICRLILINKAKIMMWEIEDSSLDEVDKKFLMEEKILQIVKYSKLSWAELDELQAEDKIKENKSNN